MSRNLALAILVGLLSSAAYAQQQSDAAKSIEQVMASRYVGFAQSLAACDANLARQSTFTREAQARVKELEAKLAELPERSTENEIRD